MGRYREPQVATSCRGVQFITNHPESDNREDDFHPLPI